MLQVSHGVNYVKESVMGSKEEAKKETGKEQAKGNVPGKDSVTDRIGGAADAVGGKLQQGKHDAKADVHKESAKH